MRGEGRNGRDAHSAGRAAALKGSWADGVLASRQWSRRCKQFSGDRVVDEGSDEKLEASRTFFSSAGDGEMMEDGGNGDADEGGGGG